MNGDAFYFYAQYSASTAGPAVVAYNPIGGDTVGTNAGIEVQFSAPIDPTTVSGATLEGGGSTVPTTPLLSTATPCCNWSRCSAGSRHNLHNERPGREGCSRERGDRRPDQQL